MPVEVGFFSFTEVPQPHHRAYNQWHQYDHLPEQYGIDGVAHGERWVATPDCLAARSHAGDAGLAASHYVTLYLFRPPIAESLDEFRRLAVELRGVDRFFEHRHSHLAAPFDVVDRIAAPGALVRAEVVPWRPATGVHVVVQPGGASPLGGAGLVDGVAGAWTFRASTAHTHPGWSSTDVTITVSWVDGDPLAVAAALAPVLSSRAPLYAGPLRTVLPGQWAWFDV